MNAAVQMNHITKKFGKLYANQDVSLTVGRNSIHGIVGENGAGKTTLMKILYGMHPADSGEIILFGEKVAFHSPKDAIEKRVGMIHQHFTLVPSMTVADNVVLGRPPIRFGVLDKERAWTEVEALCRRCNFQMDLKARVEDLPVGLKQRVEILKALYLGADVLIMDEPTAVLTPQEITGLFETLEKIRNDGTSIILITHKLSEVMDLTDHITVLRAGQVSGNVLTKDTNEVELARMMVGRDVFLQIEKEEQRPGEAVLELEHISCKNAEGVKVLKDVSLTVRRGEIVGIAGVQGNGQTELEDAIAGMDTMYAGSISVNGKKVRNTTPPLRRRQLGLGHIPEDRQIAGSAGGASVEDNFLMTLYRQPELGRWGYFSRKAGRELLENQVAQFDIKIPGVKAEGSSLSGGNMQKLIVAREYNLKPQILVASQPTRGVDIGATEFIHRKLVELRDAGCGVLLISNELSEILSLSDRIMVMYEGKIVGETTSGQADITRLGLWMAGITQEEDGNAASAEVEFAEQPPERIAKSQSRGRGGDPV